jgi:cation:H+ antiporter
MSIVLFVLGLVFLVVGAEALVKGASRLAAAFRVSPLIIGLTVVAFGTSAPELAVSIEAALAGQANIAIGNVVGSNIFNVLFILGVSALIVPLIVSAQLIRLDVPLMLALSIGVYLMAVDGSLSRMDGAILVAGLVAYVLFLIVQSRRDNTAADVAAAARSIPQEPTAAVGDPGWLLNLGLILGGLALLILGSRWLVDAAIAFAHYLGVSDLVIGLTIVAAGTSMPEVVTSIVAALRGERDIAVGNVVGSNIFNIMGVLGIASAVAPNGIDVSAAVLAFDFPIMIAVAFACVPIFFTGGIIGRREGAVFLVYYFFYSLYLYLASARQDLLLEYDHLMLYFVMPITALTIANSVVQDIRRRRQTLRSE